jgi:hypothetical protein
MTDYTMKRCSRCGVEKPATREYFSPDSRKQHGLSIYCKTCKAEIARSRYVRLPKPAPPPDGHKKCTKCEQIIPATREYFYGDNRAYDGLQQRCKPCQLAAQKEHDMKDYQAYREKERIRLRAYYRKNKEKVIKRTMEIHQRNKLKTNATRRKWRHNNPEKTRTEKLRRRARERNVPDTLTPQDWQRCLDYFNHRCAVCDRPVGFWHILAADHWIPLSDSRPDNPGTVSWNIVPLCHGDGGCNNSKNNRPAEQWLIKRFGKRKAAEILKRVTAYFDMVKGIH